MANENLLHYYEDWMDREHKNRDLCVQVLIVDDQGDLFMHLDPDGARLEGHVREGSIIQFPRGKTPRYNASSGGVKQHEHPIDTALREMTKELHYAIVGEGVVELLAEIPMFACCQVKERLFTRTVSDVYLMAGLLVVYHASSDEVDQLKTIGEFIPVDELRRQISDHDDGFRPSFALGVDIYHALLHNGSVEQMVADHNRKLITVAVTTAWDPNIIFHQTPVLEQAVYEDAAL